MNSLSWFLYLAEVVGRLQGLGMFFSFVFGMALVFYLIARAIAVGEKDDAAIVVADTLWFVPWVFLISLAFATLTPSKETVYMIAGSEAGETVVTSDEGQEILNDIKEVIRYQLGELKGTTEKSSETP